MSEIAGFDLTPNAGTTLKKIINMHLEKYLDKYVLEICSYLVVFDFCKL
jgi:hypothetical protein